MVILQNVMTDFYAVLLYLPTWDEWIEMMMDIMLNELYLVSPFTG